MPPITYTSRKGFTYYLCRGVTKTGKPRYYFAREIKDEPVEQIPAGYQISESVNGIVSLAKSRPTQILLEEIKAVEAAIARHPKAHNYRLGIKPTRLDIYERVGPDAEDLVKSLSREFPLSPDLVSRLQAEQDRYDQFTPVLRFILAETETRIFRTQRMCYLGRIDDWIDLSITGTARELAARLIPKLGTDRFFELY